jgi:hypothetical protein
VNDSPRPYTISPGGRVYPIPVADLEYDNPLQDPRGIIWLWEPPHPRANYVMGVDPTFGITGWDRALRTQDDKRVHNGAIELIRVGNGLPGMDDFSPDVQVGEYAAPIDPEDLADVANLLGRLYSGRDEDGQSLSIVEVHPGPGLVTQRRLINTHGYTNHFVWKTQDAMSPRQTAYLGWVASPRTVRDLWVRCRHHILKGGFEARSPWLVEEWQDAEGDVFWQHDKKYLAHHFDRTRAVNMALWAAHEWTFDVETKPSKVEEGGKRASWQASDMSEEGLMDAWEERWEEIGEM